MSKKIKNLGPSNDTIPEDEMLVAKLIQNAAANGLVSTRGARFRNTNKDRVCPASFGPEGIKKSGAVCCCAIGSATLSPDTRELDGKSRLLVDGNDSPDEGNSIWGDELFTAGAAFEHALRPNAG